MAELFQDESPKPEPSKQVPIKKETVPSVPSVSTSVVKKPVPKAEPIVENKIIPKKSFYSPVVSSSPFRTTSHVLKDLETLGTNLVNKNVSCNKRPRDVEDELLLKSPRLTEVFTTPKRTRNKFAFNKGNSTENQENQENDENQFNSGSKSLTRWNRSSSALSNSCGKG